MKGTGHRRIGTGRELHSSRNCWRAATRLSQRTSPRLAGRAVEPPTLGEAAFIRTDATDLGQMVAVMKGADAVIHMAAIPNPLIAPEHEVFRVNMTSDWNVLEAAEIHGDTQDREGVFHQCSWGGVFEGTG